MKNIIILFAILGFLIFLIVSDYKIQRKRQKLHNSLNSNYFIQVINKLIEENK